MRQYCYGCGPLHFTIEYEEFRISLCAEHAEKLKAFLKTLEPIHVLEHTIEDFMKTRNQGSAPSARIEEK